MAVGAGQAGRTSQIHQHLLSRLSRPSGRGRDGAGTGLSVARKVLPRRPAPTVDGMVGAGWAGVNHFVTQHLLSRPSRPSGRGRDGAGTGLSVARRVLPCRPAPTVDGMIGAGWAGVNHFVTQHLLSRLSRPSGRVETARGQGCPLRGRCCRAVPPLRWMVWLGRDGRGLIISLPNTFSPARLALLRERRCRAVPPVRLFVIMTTSPVIRPCLPEFPLLAAPIHLKFAGAGRIQSPRRQSPCNG